MLNCNDADIFLCCQYSLGGKFAIVGIDALYDILTGLPHLGRSFAIALPPEDAPCYAYAQRIVAVFEEAKKPVRLI